MKHVRHELLGAGKHSFRLEGELAAAGLELAELRAGRVAQAAGLKDVDARRAEAQARADGLQAQIDESKVGGGWLRGPCNQKSLLPVTASSNRPML